MAEKGNRQAVWSGNPAGLLSGPFRQGLPKVSEAGGNVPCALNAANEIAVAAFLEEKIRFVDMPVLVEKALERNVFISKPTYNDLVETNREIRKWV